MRYLKTQGILAASLATLILSNAAVAGTAVSAAYPDTVVNAIRDLGYKAELTKDSFGDPMIKSAASGVEFVINFYNCEDNMYCSDLHFSIAFDMPEGMDMVSMNSWNNEMLMGMAYLDFENDPVLQHYVAAVDGMSRDSFQATFTQWEESLSNFTDFIDW